MNQRLVSLGLAFLVIGGLYVSDRLKIVPVALDDSHDWNCPRGELRKLMR
ncbi:MAG: hypothetical protein RI957_972 [Verrucomicrobiota bacterium]|jgi:hypothetical protein